jgi:hypothetical protein
MRVLACARGGDLLCKGERMSESATISRDNAIIDVLTAMGYEPGAHWKLTRDGVEYNPVLTPLLRYLAHHPDVTALVRDSGELRGEAL